MNESSSGGTTSLRARVFRATSSNWLTKATTLAIRFFLTPFILYKLGDIQFGLLALISSIVGQGQLLDLGIRAALTKFVSEHHSQGNYEHARQLVATSLRLYCGLGFLALLFAAILAPAFPYLFNVPRGDQATSTIVVLLMGLQVALTLPGAAPAAVLWGMHKYHLVNALIMISTVLSSAMTVAVLLAGGGLVAMIAAYIPITFLMMPVGMLLLRRVAPELYPRWHDGRRELFRSILSFSGSTFIIESAYSLQMKTDEIIIGAMLPVSAVTPYSIASRLSALPQTVAEQTVGVFLPLASELQAQGNLERLRSLYLVGSRLTLAVGLCLSIILITLAQPLLTLWVGAKYSQHAAIVTILTLAGFAEISHWVGGTILQGIARHRNLSIAYVCAAVANIGLSILLVRSYGLIGVALGTLIPSTILSVFFVWPYASHVLHASARDLLRKVLLPALLPTVPMIAVIFGIFSIAAPSGLILTGAAATIAFVIYAMTYLVFCAEDPERQLVRTLWSRLKTATSVGKELS